MNMMTAIKDESSAKANKHRIFKTVTMTLTFFVMGLSGGIIGPTFVHLEYILNIDTQTLAISFIGENIGYLIGSTFSGIIFDRFNHELQYCINAFLMAVCFTALPWTSHFYVYFILLTIVSTANGYLDSCSQSYTLKLWIGNKFQNSILHTVNTAWTVGAFVCPFIVIPFLSPLPQSSNINATYLDAQNNISILEQNKTNFIYEEQDFTSSNSSNQLTDNTTAVRYAYMVVGLAAVLISILFLVTFVLNGPSLYNLSHRKEHNKNRIKQKNKGGNCFRKLKILRLLLIFSLATFMGIIMMGEYTFSIYISPVVIKGLGWSPEQGALITSLFRGMQAAGQVLGIPISLILSSGKLLLINLLMGITAFITMSFLPLYHGVQELVWISVALAGLSVSTSYSATMIWGVKYVKLTAAYGSILVTATGVGGMAEAALTGYLLQNYTHMWLVYLCLGANVFNLILFIAMNLTGKQILKMEQILKAEQTQKSEKNIQETEIKEEASKKETCEVESQLFLPENF